MNFKKGAAKHLISNLAGGSHASQLIQITQICTAALNKRILMRAVNPLMLGAFPLCKMPLKCVSVNESVHTAKT